MASHPRNFDLSQPFREFRSEPHTPGVVGPTIRGLRSEPTNPGVIYQGPGLRSQPTTPGFQSEPTTPGVVGANHSGGAPIRVLRSELTTPGVIYRGPAAPGASVQTTTRLANSDPPASPLATAAGPQSGRQLSGGAGRNRISPVFVVPVSFRLR